MSENPLIQLQQHGQSVWLDDLTRGMLRNGDLESLIRQDGLSGITSNPKTFHEAITGGDAYDAAIRRLASRGLEAAESFRNLAVADVREACDLLRSTYDGSGGGDGFVSLEVSPLLARDSDRTLDEAVRLWERVDRPNVLIKIPGTEEGLPAIREALARGVNVNVTLLFSLDRYRQVLDAWFEALSRRLRRGEPLTTMSVASFFLSRIDTKVDERIDRIGGQAALLRGRAAVASARLAYQIWRERFSDSSAGWMRLRDAGVRPQKLLWASTSTKAPAHGDTRYVEALVGPHTICTMPWDTLKAFRDHGQVAPTLEQAPEEARSTMERLAAAGIDMARVAEELEEEGIQKFREPYESLLHAIGDAASVPAGRARA